MGLQPRRAPVVTALAPATTPGERGPVRLVPSEPQRAHPVAHAAAHAAADAVEWLRPEWDRYGQAAVRVPPDARQLVVARQLAPQAGLRQRWQRRQRRQLAPHLRGGGGAVHATRAPGQRALGCEPRGAGGGGRGCVSRIRNHQRGREALPSSTFFSSWRFRGLAPTRTERRVCLRTNAHLLVPT
jgi:hypothetical protein